MGSCLLLSWICWLARSLQAVFIYGAPAGLKYARGPRIPGAVPLADVCRPFRAGSTLCVACSCALLCCRLQRLKMSLSIDHHPVARGDNIGLRNYKFRRAAVSAINNPNGPVRDQILVANRPTTAPQRPVGSQQKQGTGVMWLLLRITRADRFGAV